jgi:hypothetical protein
VRERDEEDAQPATQAAAHATRGSLALLRRRHDKRWNSGETRSQAAPAFGNVA